MIKIDHINNKELAECESRNRQYVSETSVNVSKNKGSSVMKKSKKSKKAVAYKMTKKESVLAESCGKSIIAGYKEFATLAECLTHYKPILTIIKGKGKNKKITVKAVKWTKEYAGAMKRLKATVKPVWLRCGMTVRQVNVRFSQYLRATYGTSMQKQTKTPKGSGVSDGEYTVDIGGKTWEKQALRMVQAMTAEQREYLKSVLILS